MRPKHWRIAGILFALAVGTAAPASAAPAPAGLPYEAARMYGFVKDPHPGELKWQQVPWLTDLREAMRVAAEEKRPLLLFVSGDDPLEKC